MRHFHFVLLYPFIPKFEQTPSGSGNGPRNDSIHQVSIRKSHTLIALTNYSLSLLNSPVFTFFIGGDEHPMQVHRAVVARLSEPLHRLLHGPMKETLERTVRLPNVDVEPFARICEYSYTGDYVSPWHKQPKTSAGELDAESSEATSATMKHPLNKIYTTPDGGTAQTKSGGLVYIHSIVSYVQSNIRDERGPPGTEFDFLKWPLNASSLTVPFDIIVDVVGGVTPCSAWDDFEYTSTFLIGHARMYSFADQYLAYKFKFRAFEKLLEAIKHFPMMLSSTDLIVELAAFVYDNDYIADRRGDYIDPMRQLVVSFMVMHHGFMMQSEAFNVIFEGIHQFRQDYVKYVNMVIATYLKSSKKIIQT
jgi:hypothetical protein